MTDVAYWFDLDGTLVEYTRSFAAMLEATLDAELSDSVHETFSREVFVALESFETNPFRAAFAALAADHDLAVEPEAAAETFREVELASTRPVSGARTALECAGEHGGVGVITNGDGELQRAKLERHELTGLLDAVVVSTEVGARKPDRAIFEAAADRLPAAVQVYVGDRYEDDVAPAAAAGFVPVHVRHDEGPAVSLAGLAAFAKLLGGSSEAT